MRTTKINDKLRQRKYMDMMYKGLAKGISRESKSGGDMVAEIIAIMFMSRTYAHMAHLKTSSFAKHKILNDFYDDESDSDQDVVELADELAEVAQGKFGKLDIPYVPLIGNVEKPTEALEMQLEKITSLAAGCEDRALSAVLDVIKGFYLKTIYLLKELQ